VLVNFWATWCPPCRKEMPDLDALYTRFKAQGFLILAISDETAEKVRPFISKHNYSFPVLLDPDREVNQLFRVEGIPKTFLYDREGKLAAQSIDMRTMGQLLALLEKAGLR
jgi:peroxiredoxin